MRSAHHRSDFRTGPHHSWLRRKAYHLAKLFAALRAVRTLLEELRPVGPGLYRLDRVYLMPKAREAFRAVAIYLDDEEGDVWS